MPRVSKGRKGLLTVINTALVRYMYTHRPFRPFPQTAVLAGRCIGDGLSLARDQTITARRGRFSLQHYTHCNRESVYQRKEQTPHTHTHGSYLLPSACNATQHGREHTHGLAGCILSPCRSTGSLLARLLFLSLNSSGTLLKGRHSSG